MSSKKSPGKNWCVWLAVASKLYSHSASLVRFLDAIICDALDLMLTNSFTCIYLCVMWNMFVVYFELKFWLQVIVRCCLKQINYWLKIQKIVTEQTNFTRTRQVDRRSYLLVVGQMRILSLSLIQEHSLNTISAILLVAHVCVCDCAVARCHSNMVPSRLLLYQKHMVSNNHTVQHSRTHTHQRWVASEMKWDEFIFVSTLFVWVTCANGTEGNNNNGETIRDSETVNKHNGSCWSNIRIFNALYLTNCFTHQ